MVKTSVSEALIKAMASVKGVERPLATKHVGVLGQFNDGQTNTKEPGPYSWKDWSPAKGPEGPSVVKDLDEGEGFSQDWDPARYTKCPGAKHEGKLTENLTQAIEKDLIASEVCKEDGPLDFKTLGLIGFEEDPELPTIGDGGCKVTGSYSITVPEGFEDDPEAVKDTHEGYEVGDVIELNGRMVRVTEVDGVLVSHEDVELVEVKNEVFDESWVCGYHEQPGDVFARTFDKTWDPVAHVMATEEDNETG